MPGVGVASAGGVGTGVFVAVAAAAVGSGPWVAVAKSTAVVVAGVGDAAGVDVAAAITDSVGGATFGPSVTAHATPRTAKRAMTIVVVLNPAVTYDYPMGVVVAMGYVLYSILVALPHESSRRAAYGIYRVLDGCGRGMCLRYPMRPGPRGGRRAQLQVCRHQAFRRRCATGVRCPTYGPRPTIHRPGRNARRRGDRPIRR